MLVGESVILCVVGIVFVSILIWKLGGMWSVLMGSLVSVVVIVLS